MKKEFGWEGRREGSGGGDSCGGEEKETIEHFIIECDKYRVQRQVLDSQVARITGREEWEMRKVDEDRGIRTVLELTHNNNTNINLFSTG